MILKLEEIALNGWPAIEEFNLDGWVIRYAQGVTKRSNSVNPIYASSENTEEKIIFCEGYYRSKGIPVCFKITEISQPEGLDQLLEKHGYEHKFDVLIQTTEIGNLEGEQDQNIDLYSDTDDFWLDQYIRMNGSNPVHKPVFRMIIDKIKQPKCLFALRSKGEVIGCGLGVVEDQFIGLFDIVIDPLYRNRGFGEILVQNILKWGKGKGATTAYLQVLADNAPALRLYEKIGFSEAYRYWYRIKP